MNRDTRKTKAQLIAELEEARAQVADLAKAKQEAARVTEALSKREREYKALVENTPDTIVRFDRAGRHIYANRAVQDELGVAPAALLGKTHRDANMADVADQSERIIRQIFETGQPVAFETTISTPTGLQHYWARGVPEFAEDGSVESALFIHHNITARKLAEEALRQSEAYFQAIINIQDDAVCRWLPDTTLTFVNARYHALFGSPGQELIGRMWLDFTPAANRNSVSAYYVDLAKHPQKVEYEHPTVISDGTLRWFHWTDVPICDATGQLVEFQSVGRDITERKQAEEALRESEARYRRLFEGAVVGIFQSTPSGQAIAVNPAFAAMFGYESPADVAATVKNVATDIFADPARRAAVAQAILGKRSLRRFENLYRRKDGSTFTGELYVWPVTDADGKVLRFEGFIEDITDRKQAELALLEGEERLRQIIQQMPYPVEVCNPDGTAAMVNQAFLEMFGVPSADLVVRKYNVFHDRLTMDVLGLGAALKRAYAGETVFIPEVVMPPGAFAGEYDAHTTISIVHAITMFPVFRAAGDIWGVVTIWQDITARKQAEENLRVKDRAMETAINALAISDLAGRLTYVNPAFLALWGYADAQAVLGKPVTEFWQFKETAAAVVQALHTAGGWIGELTAIRQDGSSLDAQVSASMVTNEAGQPTFMLASFLDISERKQAEVKLRESEARYRRLVESAPGIVYTFSTKRGGVYYSSRAEQVLGYPLEDLYAHPFLWHESIHPDDFPRVMEAIHQAGAGKPFDLEYRVRTAQGEWRWLLDRSIDYHGGGDEVVIEGLATDITEHKRAEATLRETLAHLNAILSAVPDLMFEVDRDGVIYDYHAQNHNLLYAPPPNFLGQSVAQLLPEDAAACIKAALAQAARRGTSFGALYSLPMPQGLAWFELSIAAEGNSQSPNARFVVLVRDVTARQQAEEALHDLNNQLEQRVAARTSELTEATARLIELAQIKDQFISRISHELRTPLANIKLHLELLDKGKPEKYAHYLLTLREQTDKLQQQVEDLLDVSHLSLDKIDLDYAPLAVNLLIHELMADRTSMAVEHNLTLRATLASSLPTVIVDRAVLRQALLNVLINALRYTPSGGTIWLSSALRTTDTGEWVTIEVQDTGPGISAKDLPHIFEPFYRGEVARDYKTPGTGVGLFIAERLCEKLDGRLTVRSQPGQGAAFIIWLRAAH